MHFVKIFGVCLLHTSDVQSTVVLRTGRTITGRESKKRHTTPETEMIIALNALLAAGVVIAIVGMLAWSIATNTIDARPLGRTIQDPP